MPSNETDKTLIQGHEYDGIQEYDNPTPLWWHLIWLGTMVFSVVYFFLSLQSPWFVHQTQRLERAQLAEIERLFGELGDLQADQATLVSLMDEEQWMSYGASVFALHCTSCHAQDGGGGIGPNLTDDHYLNVKTIEDIHTVIADGANNGAMPAWSNRLHPKEVVLLSSYVASLRGQNSARKGPEGEIIAPWPTAAEGG
ncbi:MAG: cbb3-type cytochrome c oxidase N-terminal domain-containing protein [Phycisphaerales bacterium]|jgi:cytochrome c oxidase cbb3-type subunit 3